jgi:phospholipid/cholesterol/gamma-HCH transport system ATP-binding protein
MTHAQPIPQTGTSMNAATLAATAPAPSPAIQIEGLWTRLGDNIIHRDVNLEVRRGEVLAIIGDSGSGKTTLLREILGLIPPTAGEIRVLGADMRHLTASQRKKMVTHCGVVFQNGALFSALSVFDNVALPVREAHFWPEELLEDLVLVTLEEVGINPADADKLPAELSGGMVKRVALARALVLEPELVFMDEPTTGLAPDQSHAIIQLVANLKQDYDLTLVIVTHDVDTLVGLADRVAVLADHRILTVGTLSEVAHFPHPFVQSFFLDKKRRCERERVAEFRSDLKLPQCAVAQE